MSKKPPECPMCEPGTCPGGAHRNALAEEGILTREQYLEFIKKEVKARKAVDLAVINDEYCY